MSQTDDFNQVERPNAGDNLRSSISGSHLSRGSSYYDAALSSANMSMAPSLESTLYETPFTSLSGFDIYLSANEEFLSSQKSSMDKLSEKLEKHLDEDRSVKVDVEDDDDRTPTAEEKPTNYASTPVNVVQPGGSPRKWGSLSGSIKERDTKEPKGKGGERIGDTGKCTPKKTLPTSPKQLDKNGIKPERSMSMDTRSSSKDTVSSQKSPNGSVKTPNGSDDMKLFKKGILGGTKALLIQKSDEVVKFVLFIMEELGVTGLPSLHQLKMKKFGDFTWEDIITKGQNEDNVPVWIVKPSTVLKLLVAHPKTSRLIERGPKESEVLSHPANARRWKEELDFPAVDDDERPVVNVPVNLFLDDTGVHKSRQWKALHCIQMQASGLPLTERPKGANIKFLGASEKVQIMDVAKVVMEDMADMKRDGVESFDANLNQKCVVKSCVDTVVADFNMLSFCCNHLGASATKFCPRCYADSDHFMSYGIPRTPGDTIRTVDRINLKCNEKDKKILRKKKGVKEHENVFWEHINPHKDIPVGLLHLIPLGMAKHLIKNIIAVCSDQQMEKLKTHLESTCNRGIFFNFFKHLDSRQGKHFKEYLQVAPLNMLFAGVEHKYVKMVALLAVIQKKSNKLSYTHEDVDELREDIRHYHQMVNANFPALKKKVKTHLILHLIEDIAMHGPPKAYNEDAFEKNHGTVREMIFHQNQKARSRDTSAKFAQSYLCEHVITGGFFKEGEEWKQASEGILHVGESTHVVKFMGKDVPGKRSVGEITKLERQKNKHPVTKATQEDVMLMALLSLNLTTDVDLAAYNLKRGKAVTTQKKELVNSGEWVKYLNTADEECYGVFEEGLILTPKKGSTHLLALMRKSSYTHCKVLQCPRFELLQTKDIVSSRNVIEKSTFMHDCVFSKCRIVEKLCIERVEHQNISRVKKTLKHALSSQMYLYNFFEL